MADIEVFATGMRFPEGPAFDEAGTLFVVELGRGRISKIDLHGTVTPFADTGGAPNGLAFGPDGDLSVCNNGGRHAAVASTDHRPGPGGSPATIQRVTPDGVVTVVLSAIDGASLNAPNDICFDAHGGCWFTDPRWDGTEEEPVPPGDLGYLAADGAATRVATSLRFPNGIGLTHDGASLLVTESVTGLVWSFPVTGPGTVGAPEPFAECGPDALPDGFAIDADGRVLVTGHGSDALHVFDADGRPEEPVHLGTGCGPSNVCFGGTDGRILYVTASGTGEVLRLFWSTPGMELLHRR
jgi:gluconolactonase